MRPIRLALIAGARPNFVKIAPLLRALEAYPHVQTTLIHTGQHYDSGLSDVFFRELEIRAPDVYLNVGSGSHGQQTARLIERLEAAFLNGANGRSAYDRVVVVGDVNSTMAAALVAVKLHVPVAHVEAGLRSFDRSMPEEINRVVTDSVSDMLFVSEPAGVENLRREGHPPERIYLVGNVMIDTLLASIPKARARDTLARFGLEPRQYGVVTLHRPSNVDDPETLCRLLAVLRETSSVLRLVFPLHPRTRRRLEEFGLLDELNGEPGMIATEPLGYLDFLALTDSGGLQEESTALGIPCLTARPNTERPVTVHIGTSTLVGNDPDRLRENLRQVLEGRYKRGRVPELWDGRAAERIAAVLASSGP